MTPVKNTPAWTPWAVLALSLFLTVAATLAFGAAVDARDRGRFRGIVAAASDQIRSRVDTHIVMLLGARGLFQSSQIVSLDEFRQYVASLEIPKRYPGVQGTGFAAWVPASEREQQEQYYRSQQPNFKVWPVTATEYYAPIVYLEPMDRRNAAAIGYDMYCEPLRRQAMDRALLTGEPAASRKVTLVQEIDEDKQPGFLIYLPIYKSEGGADPRASLWGFLYTPFRAGDLLTAVFARDPQPHVDLEVYDGILTDESALLFRSRVLRREGYEPRFHSTQHLDIAGTPWTLKFHSTPAFEEGSTKRFVPILTLLGLLVSLTLFGLTFAQVRAYRRADAERRNLNTLFEHAPAAVAVIRGPQFRYELSNPLNTELAGRPLVGLTVQEGLPEIEAQGLLALLREVYATGKPFVASEFPVKVPSRDHTIYLNGTYQPLRGPSGNIEGVMAFAYEVTEQVLARQRLEAMAEELQTAVRVRDEFLSIASHELRTPLTTLLLSIENLDRQISRGALGDVDPALLDRVKKTRNQVSRLERLVAELLDVSRLSGGPIVLHVEPLDLAALVLEVCERLQEQLARSGSTLTVTIPDGIAGQWDRVRLDQVLTNLLTNAIKYGAGKPIEISATRLEGMIRVAVRDRGIGIGAEHRDRIFGRFERAVSEWNYGGLGLGLWISRQVVETMGGKIYFESELGKGSTFFIEVPLTPPET